MKSVKIDIQGSKSIAIRHLIMNYIHGGVYNIKNLPQCRDVLNVQRALTSIHDKYLNTGEGATCMRFMLALLSAIPGTDVVLEGEGRMKQRPVAELVDALRSLGADIEMNPLHVRGKKLRGGKVDIKSDVSSQYITALMMINPLLDSKLDINMLQPPVSEGYIKMTEKIIEMYSEQNRGYNRDVVIEADWSSVANLLPWVVMTDVELEVENLRIYGKSLQPDSRITELLYPLGLRTFVFENGIKFFREKTNFPKTVQFEMSDTPDIIPVVAVIYAICGVKFSISGAGTLKFKESDRLKVLAEEMLKLGFCFGYDSDSLWWNESMVQQPENFELSPHGDHRIAMALAATSLRFEKTNITDCSVVNKSYTDFWNDIKKLSNSDLQI